MWLVDEKGRLVACERRKLDEFLLPWEDGVEGVLDLLRISLEAPGREAASRQVLPPVRLFCPRFNRDSQEVAGRSKLMGKLVCGS